MAMANPIALALLLLGSGISVPQGPVAVQEQRVDGGIYQVEGSFDLGRGISGEVAWNVLSDYDHLGRFISSIQESAVRRRQGHDVLLEQRGTGKGLLALEPFRVLLHVHELPERQIDFHDVLHRDFDVYEGSWNLKESPAGLQVVYRLWAKPHRKLPGFLGKPLFEEGAADLLDELRAEIVRRSKVTN
jgi:hypothetical protein